MHSCWKFPAECTANCGTLLPAVSPNSRIVFDTESKKVVKEALEHAQQGLTCNTIAHRLSTIRDSDVIFVLSRGQVVESGKHAQLLEIPIGVYYSTNCGTLSEAVSPNAGQRARTESKNLVQEALEHVQQGSTSITKANSTQALHHQGLCCHL